MATPLLLQAEHVAKAYAGIPALREGRLSLRAGSVHALCGGNGAGKSTLLNAIAGVVPTGSGAITMDGAKVTGASPEDIARRGFSLVDRKSTRLNSSHGSTSYAVFCLKKKK